MDNDDYDQVSIHAPAWGATHHRVRQGRRCPVSIHAPAWGATSRNWAVVRPQKCFNPRARMGRDNLVAGITVLVVRFQSTRPHGARQMAAAVADQRPGFNPRARMGRDVSHLRALPACRSFNPRARMGRDASTFAVHLREHVSIHAPAWGATHCQRVSYGATLFQSTRPHGARRVLAPPLVLEYSVSIHAPAWGATGAHAD